MPSESNLGEANREQSKENRAKSKENRVKSKENREQISFSFLISSFLLELQYSAVHYVAVCYSCAFKFIAVQECF